VSIGVILAAARPAEKTTVTAVRRTLLILGQGLHSSPARP
jgi:hypothetical protein